ncbi:hypothetical protein, partial [Flavobacterium sp.]|uniref:hypothetical protein n=1 Tax=Flavobacterium sp. TaxID=239 RepID=UPI0037BE46EE
IYTNSLEERNTLINHLINSVGYDPIAIDSLEPNITYYFKASGSLEEYKSEIIIPDEFWSEERLEKWKEDVNKRDYVEEVSAPEDTSFDFVGCSFPTNEIDIKAPF